MLRIHTLQTAGIWQLSVVAHYDGLQREQSMLFEWDGHTVPRPFSWPSSP